MSTIRAMCLHCISPVDLDPADILLTAAPSPERTGSYAYYYRGCERVTVAPVPPAAFEVVVTAGRTVAAIAASAPVHHRRPHYVPPTAEHPGLVRAISAVAADRRPRRSTRPTTDSPMG
jgi:hypothetical protein